MNSIRSIRLCGRGDCNYDGIANNYDVLSIGLYNQQSGTPRSVSSWTWQGWPSADWGSMQYCAFDKKHADCDGNGLIEKMDVNVINSNYGKMHPAKPVLPVKINGVPALHFVLTDSVVKPCIR